MGVCDLVRCGPITLVQTGCVWLGPQQVLYNMAPIWYWVSPIWSDLLRFGNYTDPSLSRVVTSGPLHGRRKRCRMWRRENTEWSLLQTRRSTVVQQDETARTYCELCFLLATLPAHCRPRHYRSLCSTVSNYTYHTPESAGAAPVGQDSCTTGYPNRRPKV